MDNTVIDETEWKDIPIEYLNNYQAHPSGFIRNKLTKRIKSTKKTDNKYIYYTFKKGKFTTSLHRILCNTFIINDDPINKTQIDHINGNKTDNRIVNLRWIIPSDNVQNRVDKGRRYGKPGITPIIVTFPDNTTKTYNSQIEVVKELSLININIIKQSINLRGGFYYDTSKHNKTKGNWIYKFEYSNLKNNDISIIEKNITIEGFTHLIAFSNGIIQNKNNNNIVTGSFDGNYYRIKPSYKNKKGIVPSLSAHRIIALTFIPNPDNKPYVNHINGNKKDNSVSNLEWVTQKENVQHAHETGLIKPYYRETYIVLQLNFDGTIIKKFDNISQAEEIAGKGIRTTCCNYTKKIYSLSNGYSWCYEKDYDSNITFYEKILKIFPDIEVFENLNYEHIRKFIIDETRPVWQLDLDGTKVKYFHSIKDAANSLDVRDISIYNSISISNHLCKGYKFKYMTYLESINPIKFIDAKEVIDYVKNALDIQDNRKLKSEICKILHENININGELKLTKPIIQLNDDGTIKRVWSGQRVTERELKLPRNTIYRYMHDNNNKNWRTIRMDEMCNL